MSIIAIALLGALNAGPAQDPAAPRVETRSEVRIIRRDGGGAPASLDADGDGVVTRDEFVSPLNSAFDRLDKDGDGRLSREELAASEGGDRIFSSEHSEGGPRVMMFGGGALTGALAGAAGAQVFTLRRSGSDGEATVLEGPGRSQIFVRRVGPGGSESMDADGDGKVSEAEFLAPLREAFQRMDADRDGFIETDQADGAASAPPR